MEHFVCVVSRLQGGEEVLARQGVKVHSFVQIDENFLRKYSKNPERALEYAKDPKAWTLNYLKENGALEFVDIFDPNGKKLDRARRFIEHHGEFLKEIGRFEELDKEVQKRYGKSLQEILEVRL